MENKELTVPKWVLIVRPKTPKMPPKISAQNFRIYGKKNSLWVSVVRESRHLFNVALTPRDTSYPDMYDCTNCVTRNIYVLRNHG